MIRAAITAIAVAVALQVLAYAIQSRYPSAGVFAGWVAAMLYIYIIKGIRE